MTDSRPSLPARIALAAVGTLSLGLGVLGALLPLLPTFPFVLLAAACYVRAWPAAHAWLLRTRTFGPLLRERGKRYLPRSTKAIVIALTLASFGSTIVFFVEPWPLKAALALLALVVVTSLLRMPTSPTGQALSPGDAE